MKNIFFIIMFCWVSFSIQSQSLFNRKNLSAGIELGLLNGNTRISGQSLFYGGIEKKNLQFFIGSGIDYYSYRSIPIYVGAKQYWGKGGRRVFVYAQGGADIPWVLNDQLKTIWVNGVTHKSQFHTGYFLDGGFGYTLFNQKNRGCYLSAGLSKKTLTEGYDQMIWNGTSTSLAHFSTLYNLNRIVLKIGFKL